MGISEKVLNMLINADQVNGVMEQDWNKLGSHRQDWKIG